MGADIPVGDFFLGDGFAMELKLTDTVTPDI